MSSGLNNFIDKFNNGDWDDISSAFGNDVGRFISLVKRRGLLNQIKLHRIHDEDVYIFNEVLLNILESNPQEMLPKIVKEFIGDVEIRPEGYYLRLRDLEELSEFFEESSYRRDYDSRSIAKKVLSEDWWEPYSDTVHDVYTDIVEELNEKNKKALAERMLELVGNEELSLDDYKSELFEDMSDDDGRFIITESNVMSVVEDEDSMNSLFKGELSDLKSQLYWLGDEAYNQAYNDMMFKSVMSELSTIFEGNHEWEQKERKDGKVVYTPYIKIRNLYGDITDFLSAFKGYSDTLYDYNSYTSFKTYWMDNDGEFLKLGRVDDYPSQSDIDNNINDGFIDRLYS